MILDFGYLCMEIFSKIETLPHAGETAKTQSHFLRTGGKAATTAIAAARMGAKVSVIGTTGADLFGKAIIDSLRREGVATSGIATSALPSGIIQSISAANGEQIRLMNAGANSHSTHAQIPDRAFNIRTFLLLHDDVDISHNLALLERAKQNNAHTMLLSAEIPAAEILEKLDFLVCHKAIGQELPCSVFAPEKTDNPLTTEIFCGILAACLQNNMPIETALHYTNTALLCARSPDDPYPYLGDVAEKLRA